MSAANSERKSLRAYLSSLEDFQEATNTRSSYTSGPNSALAAHYSDLEPLKLSNPLAYADHVSWWDSTIQDVAWHGAARRSVQGKSRDVIRSKAATPGTATSTSAPGDVDRLIFDLRPEDDPEWEVDDVGRPLGMGTAVLELSNQQRLISLTNFQRSPAQISGPARSSTAGQRSWTFSLKTPSISNVASLVGSAVTYPVQWAASHFRSEEDSHDASARDLAEARGRWVVWSNLEKAASAVLSAHFARARLSPIDSLYSRSTFRSALLQSLRDGEPSVVLSEADEAVLLKHLERDRRVALIDGDVIKMAHAVDEAVPPITKEERGAVELRSTHAKLEQQVDELKERIEEKSERISASLKTNQKQQAKFHLRSRKQLEELLDQRLGALDTLGNVLLKLEQAAGDAEIIKSYALATQTMRALLSQPALQRDHVDSTLEELSDALAEQSEVNEAVRAGGDDARRAATGKSIADEEEEERQLEEEFKALELEEKSKEADSFDPRQATEKATAEHREAVELPDVPASTVGQSNAAKGDSKAQEHAMLEN
ncbi:hypothetical protein IE81DRAFT_346042 [Ceraceosorus guamensis]|uniref:Snf7-domain-containing protein n=1 Tax=Ceraceosorus guamensis TaxID=1522189 RepID=A0A316W8S7_9BASI|nr:hypothetical protein IE81DRAFT_346042 [Ceraceosorus guamensis]PWN44105.1 hypothetical protein IE81DRAFT_346042 [Ceraceosorus guamensis]